MKTIKVVRDGKTIDLMRYALPLRPGWTKEKVMQAITNGNNGSISRDGNETCQYRNEDGNKCFVGCFIPDSEYDKKMEGKTVGQLAANFGGVLDHMPFDNYRIPDSFGGSQSLYDLFQSLHDSHTEGNLYDKVQSFLDNYFED